jgi:hypothetical protein
MFLGFGGFGAGTRAFTGEVPVLTEGLRETSDAFLPVRRVALPAGFAFATDFTVPFDFALPVAAMGFLGASLPFNPPETRGDFTFTDDFAFALFAVVFRTTFLAGFLALAAGLVAFGFALEVAFFEAAVVFTAAFLAGAFLGFAAVAFFTVFFTRTAFLAVFFGATALEDLVFLAAVFFDFLLC